MTALDAVRRRLMADLVQLLIKKVKDEQAAYIAEAMLQDLGEDECPVCLADRRREAWLHP